MFVCIYLQMWEKTWCLSFYVCLISDNIMISNPIHFCKNGWSSFLIWLCNIPLHTHTHIHISIHSFMGIKVDFMSLLSWIMMNMGIQVSLSHADFISWGCIHWYKGYIVDQFSVFQVITILFSIMTLLNWSPTNSVLGLIFLWSYQNFVTFKLIYNSHFNKSKTIPHCTYELHFPHA